MNTLHYVKHSSSTGTLRSVPLHPENDEAKNLEVLTALNQCLAHAIDLRSRIKQAYWSAKGGNFYMLHKKFNDFTGELDAIADELATRVLGLGGVPVRSIAIVAQTSKLPPYPLGAMKALEHLEAVIGGYEAASGHLPAAMKKAVNTGDLTTAGVLTGFAKLLDDHVAFVTSHIPAEWVSGARVKPAI